MKYDVFISYSRKDVDIATQICKVFEMAGITYFIDFKGIGGGFEFPAVLANNIIASELFLYLASKNSYESGFTTNEITFAFKKKGRDRIIPYIIDGSTLPLSHEFIFSGINCRNINDHPIETTLVTDILKLLGRENRAYKVGDYYDDGEKRGVVFETFASGKHGKIVSLVESETSMMWASSIVDRNTFSGMDEMSDGSINMSRVKYFANWRNKYPAFAWCSELGDGWYLPAINELETLITNVEVHNAVNRTLESRGYTLLKKKHKDRYWLYWSSTELEELWMGELCVRAIDVDDGVANYYNKSHLRLVRAVSFF